MQKQQKEKQQVQSQKIQAKQSDALDEFQQVLNNFDQTPLNLTNQEKNQDDGDEDPEMMNKVKEQYEKFMKEMQGGFQNQDDDAGDFNLDNLGNMLGNLMKGMAEQMGEPMDGTDQFSKKFTNMFKNINEDNVEDAATQLLNQFMDKSLLLEPMQETKGNYEQFFNKCKNGEVNCSKEDIQNYQKQYEVVNKIINVLETSPDNKAQMIKLFEQMQQYGNPPEGIAPHYGGLM